MRVGIMQPYFLPYLGYWQLLSMVDAFVIYDNIQYTKKGWINRNRFLQNGRAAVITVPLRRDAEGLDVCQRSVAEEFDRAKLLNRLKASYERAPHFRDAFPIVETAVRCSKRNLFEYILSSVVLIKDYLGIDTPLTVSSTVAIDHALRGQAKVLALCRALGASDYVNLSGGVALYSREDFAAQGIELRFIRMRDQHYEQQGGAFVPNLSIVDVMMFNSRERLREMLADFELVSGLDIRRVRAAHEIAGILRAFDSSFPRSITSRDIDPATHAEKLLARGQVYAAESAGRCLGFVAFYANDALTFEGYVTHIAVAAEHRGAGIGQRLMNACLRECRSAGMKRIRLEVDNDNSAAIAFYESLSFSIERPASAVSVYMTAEIEMRR